MVSVPAAAENDTTLLFFPPAAKKSGFITEEWTNFCFMMMEEWTNVGFVVVENDETPCFVVDVMTAADIRNASKVILQNFIVGFTVVRIIKMAIEL